MNHLVIAVTFTAILRIVSGAPPLTCDKIKDVNQGKDNQDRYLVILKDPKSYQDTEYVMRIVDLYQRSLEMNAFNVHDNSVKSQLELLENVGLQGTLSKQALVLVSFTSTMYSLLLIWTYDGWCVDVVSLTYIGVYGQQSRINHNRLPNSTGA